MSDFEEIELLFAKLLLGVNAMLSEAEMNEIRSYLDVGEYGLALQTTDDILAEEEKNPPTGVASLMAQLATAMLMDLNELKALRLKDSRGKKIPNALRKSR